MPKRVLVVDDSSMMRKAISRMLEEAGYAIAGEARNGKEAVDLYGKLNPDAVTMDITMREMDGVEAAKRILGKNKDARIVFFSNLDDEKFLEETKRIGAKGFANKHKPPDLVTLMNAVFETT